MKEAAGEANMTVVTIILIGAVVAIATPIITNMVKGIEKRTCCANAGGVLSGSECYVPDATGKASATKVSNWWDKTGKKCAN